MNKQDWYLNQLDITQYVLRNPAVMKGESAMNIADNIRLIVISQSVPTDKIFYDILKAIHLTQHNCLILSPAQFIMPIEQLNHVIWFIDHPLPDNWLTSPLLKSKAIITTAPLTQLALAPNLKRQLWNNLCQYENYFNA